MGLFSNNNKGRRSHPFLYKPAKSTPNSAHSKPSAEYRSMPTVLFIKQYDIMNILREILMPQNQN